MCVFKAPTVTPAAPLPAVAAEQDPTVTAARDRERKRQAAAASGSTILTGGQGVTTPADGASKTLLGQ